MKHLYIILVLATCFYYTIEPIRNLIVNYQQLQVMYKVDSLNKKLKYSESRIKSLETRYDSLFCELIETQNELEIEREEKLKLLTESNYSVYKALFAVLLFLLIFTLFIFNYKNL